MIMTRRFAIAETAMGRNGPGIDLPDALDRLSVSAPLLHGLPVTGWNGPGVYLPEAGDLLSISDLRAAA